MKKLGTFGKSIKAEMLKVTWPSWKDTVKMSLVVFAFVAFFALILGSADYVFNLGRQILIQK